MVYKRRRSYSAPGYRKRRKTYRRRVPYRGRRKGMYRSRRSYARGSAIRKSINVKTVGLPAVFLNQLTYRDAITMTTTTGGVGTFQVYRLNSIFDPNHSFGGNQPRYYDQMVAMGYRRYVVYKADVEVVLRNTSATVGSGGSDVVVGCRYGLDPGWTTALTPPLVWGEGELPRCNTKVLTNPNFGGDDNKARFKYSIKMNKVFGVTKGTIYSDNEYTAPIGANPVKEAFIAIVMADDPNDGLEGLTVDCETYIKYHVKWFEPIFGVPQS